MKALKIAVLASFWSDVSQVNSYIVPLLIPTAFPTLPLKNVVESEEVAGEVGSELKNQARRAFVASVSSGLAVGLRTSSTQKSSDPFFRAKTVIKGS